MQRTIGIVRASAVIVIAHNLETATDLAGLAHVTRRMVNSMPTWLSWLDKVALNKWVLAGASLVMGMWMADWLVRRSMRLELEPGRWPLKWIEHRRRTVLLALRHPATVGRLIDVRTELATLDRALQGPAIGFPPIPCLDPDVAAIDDTIVYLQVIASLKPTTLGAARRRAAQMTGVVCRQDDASPSGLHILPRRLARMLGRRGGTPQPLPERDVVP